ncbi:MAG: hypothetical protein ACI9H6_000018 [Patiriisocius sp.]|jgi:hypothetical protein
MTPVPEVKPLAHGHRRFIFIASVSIFCIAVPALVFYATGYRLNFFDASSDNITSVGGMYVSSELRDVEMYLDEEQVDDMRVFQNASYIQNLNSGMHQIHVQGEAIQTWVKELPVYSHIVTEAQSFNMPAVSQIRVVNQWNTADNLAVLFDEATSTKFAHASITNSFFLATTTATSTYTTNPEHEYIGTLFASSTEIALLLQQQRDALQLPRFNFSTPVATTTVATTTMATTTKTWRDIELSETQGEVVARWVGSDKDIPYYFCVNHTDVTTTIATYGAHVYGGLVSEYGSSTDPSYILEASDRLCRSQIRIDRLWQEVAWFEFYPNNRDHVLMLLQDGLYVVEIDDRAWQNTQLLYAGTDLQVVLDGGRIFIEDDTYFVEVFTEIQ